MTTEITPLMASQLAIRYMDAMVMVNTMDASHCEMSPLSTLEAYLQISKRCGVALHNFAWERKAEKVVAELTLKRRNAMAQALSIHSERAAR
jgi:hypothetical protein